jgi:uncharacterized protein YjiS (DUF1127 family)
MSSLAPSPIGPERPFDVTGPLRTPGHLLEDLAATPTGGLARRLRRLSAAAALWHARWQQRRQLRRLDDRLLRDIGLDRADVRRELGKPFWRP